MEWIDGVSEAIRYIEDHITGDLSIERVAKQVHLSPFYFQKGFAMLCGFTVGEYIRRRRLTLAGSELACTDEKIIDIALKYGYDSPDSFTKAFIRFHGVTPTAVRRDGAMIKSFAPLKIKFSLEGGYLMDYKIVEKDAFSVMGLSGMFRCDTSNTDLPQFWTEFNQAEKKNDLCGMYGICFDGNGNADEFEYLIADACDPSAAVPEGLTKKSFPRQSWAVFACRGPMPLALQEVNRKIYSEWLPNCRDYEIAADYDIEMYTDISCYPKGNQDESYYSEIWIPVKKK